MQIIAQNNRSLSDLQQKKLLSYSPYIQRSLKRSRYKVIR